MAKKSTRVLFGLVCTECSTMNYVSEKSKINTQEPITLTKYCPVCKKHTEHKEKKKLD
ncbi:50S ribosomal protein L33 [Candidatus Roizmanbacteria bacterium]|nr:MAG: 50S ribosomal protein L33 [Candidatus Roizmanbacteria bacterium]